MRPRRQYPNNCGNELDWNLTQCSGALNHNIVHGSRAKDDVRCTCRTVSAFRSEREVHLKLFTYYRSIYSCCALNSTQEHQILRTLQSSNTLHALSSGLSIMVMITTYCRLES